MKKLIYIMVVVLLSFIVYGTKIYPNTLIVGGPYCRMYGNCVLNNLTVMGDVFNVTTTNIFINATFIEGLNETIEEFGNNIFLRLDTSNDPLTEDLTMQTTASIDFGNSEAQIHRGGSNGQLQIEATDITTIQNGDVTIKTTINDGSEHISLITYETSPCFSGDTLISTPLSDIGIKDLRVGDTVTSYYNGQITYSKVTDLYKRKVSGYYLLNGIKVTGEHPFYTNEGWKRVKDLTFRDTLYTLNGWTSLFQKEYIRESLTVYNLEVDNTHNYFANGYLVHNKQPTGGTITSNAGGNINMNAGVFGGVPNANTNIRSRNRTTLGFIDALGGVAEERFQMYIDSSNYIHTDFDTSAAGSGVWTITNDDPDNIFLVLEEDIGGTQYTYFVWDKNDDEVDWFSTGNINVLASNDFDDGFVFEVNSHAPQLRPTHTGSTGWEVTGFDAGAAGDGSNLLVRGGDVGFLGSGDGGLLALRGGDGDANTDGYVYIGDIGLTGTPTVVIANHTLDKNDIHATSDIEVDGNLYSDWNLSIYGEISPNGNTCANGQIIKKQGASDWVCSDSTDNESILWENSSGVVRLKSMQDVWLNSTRTDDYTNNYVFKWQSGSTTNSGLSITNDGSQTTTSEVLKVSRDVSTYGVGANRVAVIQIKGREPTSSRIHGLNAFAQAFASNTYNGVLGGVVGGRYTSQTQANNVHVTEGRAVSAKCSETGTNSTFNRCFSYFSEETDGNISIGGGYWAEHPNLNSVGNTWYGFHCENPDEESNTITDKYCFHSEAGDNYFGVGNHTFVGNVTIVGNLNVSGCICYDNGATCLGTCV